MGNVIDIMPLISAKKDIIRIRRKLKRLGQAVAIESTKVLEAENVTAIVRNGTITILPKIKDHSDHENIIA